MFSSKTILAALLAAFSIATLTACGSGSGSGDSTPSAAESTTATGTGKEARNGYGKNKGGPESGPTIEVRNGEPVGGVEELEYSAGEEVEFTVSSDTAGEIHVHGYDLMKDVEAGRSVSFSFPADIEGIFEVELEETATQIAELRVNP